MEGISCTRPVCMSVLLAPDQQLSHHGHRVSRYLPLCMLDFVTQDQYSTVFFLSSFMRLAGLLQLLNSRHFWYICKRPPLYQHTCLLELYLTSRYVWISCNWLGSTSVDVGAESAGISVILASDPQLCSYARTPPQNFQLYRPFSIPWHLYLHLFDRVFPEIGTFMRIIWYYCIIRLSRKSGLESGVWINGYDYQNKDKNTIRKNLSPLFFPCWV